MSWLQFHSQSEKYACSADVAGFDRDFDRARHFYRLAADQEELALGSLDRSKSRTLGITAVSAAALWDKAGEKAVRNFVLPRIVADISDELLILQVTTWLSGK
jgi:hypothetical protein